MSNFPLFNNMSARFDALKNEPRIDDVHISVSRQHHIFASITRLGLFNTGGIEVELISISKSAALFKSGHHSMFKSMNKDMTVELYLNGKCCVCEAYVIQQDIINTIYGIKFYQPLEAIDDYLLEFNIYPHYGLNTPKASCVWLDLASA